MNASAGSSGWPWSRTTTFLPDLAIVADLGHRWSTPSLPRSTARAGWLPRASRGRPVATGPECPPVHGDRPPLPLGARIRPRCHVVRSPLGSLADLMKTALLGVQADGNFLENEACWPSWRPWIIEIAGEPLYGTLPPITSTVRRVGS
jgi:hypothetical protein